MSIISIPAHFDGNHILLDQDVQLPHGAKLIVSLVADEDEERAEFLKFASSNLARAYEGDEVEYSASDCIDQ